MPAGTQSSSPPRLHATPTRSSSSRATAPTTRRSTAPPARSRSGSCRAEGRASCRARSGCRATRGPPQSASRALSYAGPFPFTVNKTARFDGGLDFTAPKAVTPASIPRLLLRAFRGTLGNDPAVLAGHDVDRVEVRCDPPLPLQADGEDLGDVTEAL